MVKTSGWAAASRQSGNTCARDSSMRSTSPFPRSSSAPGNTFSPVSTQPSSVMSAASTLPRRTPRTLCLQSQGHDHHRPRSKRGSNLLEAEVGHDVSAFIFDHVGTLRALERRLGVFIAERGGFLVIGFGGACILRSAAPALCKRAHALQGPGMILR